MQRLTDDGAAQKLPPSGLNTETAQGDALPTVMLLSPFCFTLYAPSKVYCNISLHVCALSYLCWSLLPVVQWLCEEMKCVDLALGLVFHQLSVK